MQTDKMAKVQMLQDSLNNMMGCFNLTDSGGGTIDSGYLDFYMKKFEDSINALRGIEPKVEEQNDFKNGVQTLKEQIEKIVNDKFNRGTPAIITQQISYVSKILTDAVQLETKQKADRPKPLTFTGVTVKTQEPKKENLMEYLNKFMEQVGQFGKEKTNAVVQKMSLDANALKKLIESESIGYYEKEGLKEDLKKLDMLIKKHMRSDTVEENPSALDKLQASFTDLLKEIREKISKMQKEQTEQAPEKGKGPGLS